MEKPKQKPHHPYLVPLLIVSLNDELVAILQGERTLDKN